MKIGLPRALLYYYYNPLWQEFFQRLGFDVAVSGPTTKAMVDIGIKYSVAEICVPLKIFCGHTASLLARGADYVFVPRMISVERHKYFCPKFLGLPDMIRHLLPQAEGHILSPDIRCNKESIEDFSDYQSFAKPLGLTGRQVKDALIAARKRWLAFRALNRQGFTIDEALAQINGAAVLASRPSKAANHLTIGLLGYVYNIYDSFIGMDIIQKLQLLGANVITFEMLDDQPLVEKLRPLNKSLPWTFSNKLLGAGYNFFDDSKIDGLIHVTAFGCGPDSMLGRMLEFTAVESNKPFMTIRVDEHSGEAHLATRVEAFMDMLKRKKFPA